MKSRKIFKNVREIKKDRIQEQVTDTVERQILYT